MATYIELNPIRKKYVSDLKNYRFCSYGEACGSSHIAKANLIRIVNLYTNNEQNADTTIMNKQEFNKAWQDCVAWYRIHIFTRGKTITDNNGKIIKAGFTDEQIKEVKEQKRTSNHSRVNALQSSTYVIWSCIWGKMATAVFRMNLSPINVSPAYGPNNLHNSRANLSYKNIVNKK